MGGPDCFGPITRQPKSWAGPRARLKGRSAPRRRLGFEELEERTLLSVTLTADEQFMLELINRARANPAAEAARFGIDLNEGLAPGTISSTPKQPLAPDDALRAAIIGHLDDMIANDFFEHTGSSGSSFTERIEAAGYTNWTTAAENLAWQGSTGAIDVTSSVEYLHELLFVDSGISGRGHRRNMLNGNLREVGSGVRTGQFAPSGTNYNAVVLGQDFATAPGNAFLTGVAYTDGIDDDFYTVGEGLASITVTARNAADDLFSTTTGPSGGYALALPADVYTVTASGGSLGGIIVLAGVAIGSINLKLDFTPDQVSGAGVPDTIGLFDPAASRFYLRSENSAGPADVTFGFGPQGAGWTQLRGDFDNDGTDSVGLFAPGSSTFFLKNTHAGGAADVSFRYGPAGAGWGPVAGDWNGDGTDTVGLFDSVSGRFFLSNSNAPGPADLVVRYGPAGSGWTPIVGDWDGDGTDTIGLFDPVSSTFFLKNANTSGTADLVFRFGPSEAGWLPLAGDWDGDDIETVGLFSPGSSTFFLRDSHTPGAADAVFRFGPTGAGWLPTAGNWGLTGSSASAADQVGAVANLEGGATGIARAFAEQSPARGPRSSAPPQRISQSLAPSPALNRAPLAVPRPSGNAVKGLSHDTGSLRSEDRSPSDGLSNGVEELGALFSEWAGAVDRLFAEDGPGLDSA